MRFFCPTLLLAPLLALLAGCGDGEPSSASAAAAPYVATTFYPTTYFAERIAGDTVPVVCPLPEDTDPVTWQPSRAALERYQAATVIVVNGASFERWTATASLPESRVVDASRSFSEELVAYGEATTHSHGGGAAHTHEGVDGHTWLDPQNAMRQAESIERALARRFPEHAELYAENLKALRVDLDLLHRRYAALALRVPKANLVASHPAYNYLAQRYAWEITNLDLDPEVELLPEDRTAIEAALDPERPNVMLWESEPLATTKAELERMGVTSVLFTPAETRSPAAQAADLDYLTIQNGNVDRLAAALPE